VLLELTADTQLQYGWYLVQYEYESTRRRVDERLVTFVTFSSVVTQLTGWHACMHH
jgi:hypothetical protein